jgi:glucose/arabinose dehydrogenase
MAAKSTGWARKGLLGLALLAIGLGSAALLGGRSSSVAGVLVRAETVAQNLQNPWSVAFLDNGSFLVTEHPGRLRVIDKDGRVGAPIRGLPQVVSAEQAGLLDIALAPDFASSRTIFMTYTEPRGGDRNGTTVASALLSKDLTSLENLTVVFRQDPVQSNGHFGSRLVFALDGNLFVALGDRQTVREKAQDLSSTLGKVIRIRPDGSIPGDNPFVGKPPARPEIWSLGHRNIQAAALHPDTKRLWTIEHGARGGDEVNAPRAGLNYGWPVISYGVNYDGSKIGIGTAKEGMEQPIHYWDPSIAPSGMAFVTSNVYDGLKGKLLVGGLTSKALSVLTLDREKVVSEERLLGGQLGRIRDVRQGPDGYIYLLTDERNGRLVKLVPQ